VRFPPRRRGDHAVARLLAIERSVR